MLYIYLNEYTFTPKRRGGAIVPGWFLMYRLETCEKCGVEGEGANAVYIELGDDVRGLDIRDRRPRELGYCETFGGVVCEYCHAPEGGDNA